MSLSRRAKIILCGVLVLLVLPLTYVVWLSGTREPLRFRIVEDSRHKKLDPNYGGSIFLVEVRNEGRVDMVLRHSFLRKPASPSAQVTHFLDMQHTPPGTFAALFDREAPIPAGGTAWFTAHEGMQPPEWFSRDEEYVITHISIPAWKHRLNDWLLKVEKKLPAFLQGDWAILTVHLTEAPLDVSRLRDYPPPP